MEYGTGEIVLCAVYHVKLRIFRYKKMFHGVSFGTVLAVSVRK